MTSKKLRKIASALLAIGLVSTTIAAPAAGAVEYVFASHEDAVPGVMPPGADATAIFIDESGQVMPTAGTANASAEADGLWCTPVSGRDNPHLSLGDVSGHGWWDKGTCSNNLADVYNCLAEWYTDNSWRWKACSPLMRLYPGGGSGNRTTARKYCESTALTSWRNYVDVNVVDEWDSGEQPYNGQDVYCRVFS